MYILRNGSRTYDVVAFRYHWGFVVPFHGFHTRSKAECCRKPKYFVYRIDIGVHDFIWSWIAYINKQGAVLDLFLFTPKAVYNIQGCKKG